MIFVFVYNQIKKSKLLPVILSYKHYNVLHFTKTISLQIQNKFISAIGTVIIKIVKFEDVIGVKPKSCSII